MRPINRGPWPTDDNGLEVHFPEYGHAKVPLIERIGEYCSHCERPGDLHLEHVVPKSVKNWRRSGPIFCWAASIVTVVRGIETSHVKATYGRTMTALSPHSNTSPVDGCA